MAKKRDPHSGVKLVLILLILLMIAATALLIKMCIDLPGRVPATIREETQAVTLPTAHREPETTAPPETEPVSVQSVTIGAQGDLLMHLPVINTCKTGDGYDFSYLFQYTAPYTAGYDYMVANLETTLGGPEFPIQGNPEFNCPDEILDAVKAAGYDLLLTANNHSYDTLMTGIDRTLAQVRGVGLESLGTRLNTAEPRYSIIEVGGIRIGMVCYTFTLATDTKGRPQLNNNSGVEEPEQINFFSYSSLNKLYGAAEDILEEMKAQGAEVTIFYPHWGTEYEIVENGTQRTIAQKLCDLGYDVIVGGHPHVVQPVSLLTSATDPEHKTLCLYSMGNAISNQRREKMRLKTGHTEDGAIFTVTFDKFSDGTVRFTAADVLPTWVNMTKSSGSTRYYVLPLDAATRDQWQEKYAMTNAEYAEAKNSYDRTMAIVGDGLESVREYLAGVGA